jgi:DNA-binding transcriptional ArsR family regulator
VAKRAVPRLLTISDPRAVRALAHPVRVTAIEVLYGQDTPRTATELSELTGITPSAMSYHLRSLEHHGIVRRSVTSSDGRERPWERTAQELSVKLRGETSIRAGVAATDALISAAMESDRAALIAAQRRQMRNDGSVPFDRVARYQRNRIVVTSKEARVLYREIDRLIDQYRSERRATIPPRAGFVTLTVLGVSDEVASTPSGHARGSKSR